MSNDGTVRPEDYQEPHCPLIDPATGQPCKTDSVPMQRVVEKLDEYCDRKDFTGARRHLDYWLAEAQYIHDKRGGLGSRGGGGPQAQDLAGVHPWVPCLERARRLACDDCLRIRA